MAINGCTRDLAIKPRAQDAALRLLQAQRLCRMDRYQARFYAQSVPQLQQQCRLSCTAMQNQQTRLIHSAS